MIRIRLFGGLSVSRDDQRLLAPSATQPRRLAILATIAHTGERGVSRDRLHSLFWADANEDVARRGLTQALYALRTGLNAEQLFHGVQELRLNREDATCDVLEYIEAIDGGEPERAAAMYIGPYLDGFRVPGLPDFDRRVDEHRDELARRHESLIERLAVRATKHGELDRAVEWWRQRAAMDALSARITEAYMRALAATGDRIGALRHARIHEQLVLQEFGSEPGPELSAYSDQLRRELEAPIVEAVPTPATSGAAIAPPVAILPPAPTGKHAVLEATEDASSAPRRRMAVIAASALVTGVAALLLILNLRVESRLRFDDVDLRTVRVSAPQRIAADDLFELDPAISPDGRHIAYAAGDEGAMRLYVRQRDGSQAIPVAESVAGDQRRPRWSPDGAQLAFQAGRGIWVAPALGGAARLVVEPQAGTAGATSPSWSPNGQEVAWTRGDTIYRQPIGGERSAVASVYGAHSLAWSPDGQWIAAVSGNSEFDVGSASEQGRSGVAVGNLAPSAIVLVRLPNAKESASIKNSAAVHVLVPATTLNASPAWLDKRTLIFVSNRGGTRDLFAAHITDDGAIRGSIERVTAGLDAHSVSASSDGRHLAYAVFRHSANIWSLPVRSDASTTLSAAVRVTQGAHVVEGIDVSIDGKWLAYDADVAGQQDIFRLPLRDGAPASREAERIVSSPEDDFHPTWSPDGQWLAYYTFRANVRRAAYVSANGGAARLVHPSGPIAEEHSPIWSGDGKSLVYFRGERSNINLHRASRLNDTTWSRSQRVTTRGGMGSSVSADGKQMVYFSAPGIVRLADSTWSENASRILLSAPPSSRGGFVAMSARISPDGRALIVKGSDDSSSGFWSLPVVNGRTGTPQVIVRFLNQRRGSPRPEFASDGRFLYFTLAEREADVWALQLEKR